MSITHYVYAIQVLGVGLTAYMGNPLVDNLEEKLELTTDKLYEDAYSIIGTAGHCARNGVIAWAAILGFDVIYLTWVWDGA